MRRNACRGSSVLEQALVYPLLLGIVVAAVDVSRVLQGYSVLDQGMRSALRCVSPANGACINSNSSITNAAYDVYENITPTRYRVQQHRYLGDASWIAQPVNQINRIQAAVVSSVTSQRDQHQFRYQLERFRPQGSVGFAVETSSFPYVTRENVPYLLPRLQVSEDSSRLADPTVRIDAPNLTVRHVSRRDSRPDFRSIPSDSIKFTIPRAAVLGGSENLEASEECFVQSSAGVDFGLKCGSETHFNSVRGGDLIRQARSAMNIQSPTSRDETELYAFVVLDIRGQVSSSTGARGRVTLRVSQPGGINRRLGGRIVSGVGASNFVPRGGPPQSYDTSINSTENYEAEVISHQAILLRLGVEATLHFEIEEDDRNSDLLEWRASQISIYTPKFEARSALATCDSLVSRARFNSNPAASCSKSLHPAGMPRVNTLSLAGTPEQILQEDLCMAGEATQGIPLLAARGVEEAENYRPVSGPSAHACGKEASVVSCPENKGVAGLGLAGFDSSREVCGSSLARSVCPLPDWAEVANSCWKVEAKDITPVSPVNWVQRTCAQTGPLTSELPESVRQYPEIMHRSGRLDSVSEKLYTGNTEPSRYKGEHPELDCTDMKVDGRPVGVDLTELKPESLFRVTSALGNGYRDLLFSDAQRNFVDPKNNLDPRVFFLANEQMNSVLVDSPPSDPKQVYWVEPGGPGEWQLIASRIPDSQTPPQCIEHPERCRRELVSVTTTGPTGPEYSAERAAAFGYQAVQAAMPALEQRCASTSKACAQLDVEEEFDETGKIFVARGEIRVPLILSPKPYTISRVSRARWERDLVDK